MILVKYNFRPILDSLLRCDIDKQDLIKGLRLKDLVRVNI